MKLLGSKILHVNQFQLVKNAEFVT